MPEDVSRAICNGALPNGVSVTTPLSRMLVVTLAASSAYFCRISLAAAIHSGDRNENDMGSNLPPAAAGEGVVGRDSGRCDLCPGVNRTFSGVQIEAARR
ncbi:unannotated protein [freshwater metagenome]|uniref:Unannotated protein n=1 Tax=freshwater metagenome TaxID=449393 RepID=A0A6J7C6X6_9ZZZZ